MEETGSCWTSSSMMSHILSGRKVGFYIHSCQLFLTKGKVASTHFLLSACSSLAGHGAEGGLSALTHPADAGTTVVLPSLVLWHRLRVNTPDLQYRPMLLGHFCHCSETCGCITGSKASVYLPSGVHTGSDSVPCNDMRCGDYLKLELEGFGHHPWSTLTL